MKAGNSRNLGVILCVSLAVSGCASITSSEMQTVALNTTTKDGHTVKNAKCTLKNDKGEWEAKSPGLVSVHRSAEDLMVECKSDEAEDGLLRAISRAAGGMWGNIIFGGGIGAIIDHTKGTGYNYPDDLPVKMGASVTVDRSSQQQQQSDQMQTTTTAKNEDASEQKVN